MTRRRSLLMVVLAVVSSALSACGGGDTSSATRDRTTDSTTDETSDVTSAPTSTVVVPSGASPKIILTAQDIFFEPKELTAGAGKLTLSYVNKGKIEHSLLIEGQPGLNLKVPAGGEAQGDVSLAAGEYLLYCDIAGHREAGMEAKLHVK